MATLISDTSWPDQPGATIATDSEIERLGVRSLLTTTVADVFRTTGVPQAVSTRPMPTDSAAGGALRGATTRSGTTSVPLPTGASATATTYAAAVGATSGAEMAPLAVRAGVTYRALVWLRRQSGSTVTGAALHVSYPTASGPAVASSPMSGQAQGTAFQQHAVTFTPTADGLAVVTYGRDVSAGAAFTFGVAAGVLEEQPRFAAGSRAARIWLDLGAARRVRVAALAAPRDGVLPAAGSTVRLTASNAGADGAELLDTGALALDMPRGLWPWLGDVTARWWRLDLNWPSGYVQFGRLWLGDALVSRPQDYDGHEQGVIDSASQGSVRTLQFAASFLPDADAAELERIALAAGTQRQVLVIPRTTLAARTGILGRFTRPPMPQLMRAPLGRRSAVSLALQEDR